MCIIALIAVIVFFILSFLKPYYGTSIPLKC